MAIAHVEPGERVADQYEVRTIGTAELRESLAQGWADLLERRGDLIFVGLIYPLVGIAAAIMALGGSLIPLLFPIAMGIALLGPAAAVGFYELARRREQGLESGWAHFLDATRRPAFDSLIVVTALLFVIFLAWLVVAAGLYSALMGPAPESVATFVTRLFTTWEGWTLIVVGNLAGILFAALVLTVSVVSMPMLVDKDVDARTAIATSMHAVAANKGVMLRWGIIVAALLVAGSIPFFVGLAVVLPVLGYATWHLYTKLVVR